MDGDANGEQLYHAIAVGSPLALLLGFPSSSESAPKPNILFLLVDDLRHDTFGFAGHKICQTPHLDTLAAESHIFRNAFVTTAICMVSRASIFTGQYEARHQIHDFRTEFTAAAWGRAYPELLKQAGYAAVDEADLITDPQGSAAYKRELLRVTVGRAVRSALEKEAG